jgi:hypothetical protein
MALSPEYIAAPDAARRLGVPYRTLINWLTDEEGPIRGKQEANGTWKISGAALERLENERTLLRDDAQARRQAARIVREDVVHQRPILNQRIREIAARLTHVRPNSAEWDDAMADMRKAQLEDSTLFGVLEVAGRLQAEAYKSARAVAERTPPQPEPA